MDYLTLADPTHLHILHNTTTNLQLTYTTSKLIVLEKTALLALGDLTATPVLWLSWH